MGKEKVYRTALIGSGWWGMNILRCAIRAGQSKVVALCDADRSQMEKAAAEVTSLNGDKPKFYGDYRELLSREKPDIVIVATPDPLAPAYCHSGDEGWRARICGEARMPHDRRR